MGFIAKTSDSGCVNGNAIFKSTGKFLWHNGYVFLLAKYIVCAGSAPAKRGYSHEGNYVAKATVLGAAKCPSPLMSEGEGKLKWACHTVKSGIYDDFQIDFSSVAALFNL